MRQQERSCASTAAGSSRGVQPWSAARPPSSPWPPAATPTASRTAWRPGTRTPPPSMTPSPPTGRSSTVASIPPAPSCSVARPGPAWPLHACCRSAGSVSRDPLVSPALADLDGLPPLLIIAGGAECLLSCAERIAANATAAGVQAHLSVYPDKVHGWMLLPRLPATIAASKEITSWIAEHLEHGQTEPFKAVG